MADDLDTSAETTSADPENVALYARLKAYWKEWLDYSGDWREEARESYGFVSGDGQWSQEDQAVLREQMRPVVTFNRVGAVCDSVAGLEVGNRQEVQYLPREATGTDVPVNEALTAAAKFFRDECQAEDEESDAFFDTIVCGMGWTETRPNTEDDPEGTIDIERFDPLEAAWDPTAKKRNLADSRWRGRAKQMPMDEARQLFPDRDPAELHASWADPMFSGQTEPHDADPQLAYEQEDSTNQESRRKKVILCYIEWWDRESYEVAIDPFTQQRTEMSPEKMKLARARLAQIEKITGQKAPALKTVPMTRKTYRYAWLGNTVLETGEARDRQGFSLHCITGKRDRNKNYWYGLVRPMKDPQRWANKFFSTILYRISTVGKGVLAETDAVANVRDFEDKWARPEGVKWLKPGALKGGKIQELQGAAMTQAESAMMEFAISSIRDVTGVNLELLGLADREQPGVLEYQRKQAGMTILATLFDALRRYRKMQGRTLLNFIQRYIPEGRLVRIEGETGYRYVPLMKMPDTAKFDVIVDQASTSPNAKEAGWAVIQAIAPVLMKAGLPPDMMAEMLEYSPLPSALVEKLKQRVQQMMANPPPDPKVQAIQAKAQIDQQSAQQDMALQQQKAALDANVQMTKLRLDAAQQQQEMAFEREKFGMEMQQDQARFAQDMMQDRAMGAIDLQQQREAGEQKMQLAQQQAEQRAAQMKAQAKARPQPK